MSHFISSQRVVFLKQLDTGLLLVTGKNSYLNTYFWFGFLKLRFVLGSVAQQVCMCLVWHISGESHFVMESLLLEVPKEKLNVTLSALLQLTKW